MRLLVVYCHPVPESYCAAMRDTVIAAAQEAGHEVRLKDLYAEGFDPVMGPEERRLYNDAGVNEAPVEAELEALRWAEGLIFVHPTWWMSLPAMLKGWLDRVFVPHVAFKMPTASTPIGPGLTHIRLVGQVTTMGSPWWLWTATLRPGRRILLAVIAGCCAPGCKTFHLGLHKMDSAPPEKLTGHLARIRRRILRIPL